MASNKINKITVSIKWEKEQTDLRCCDECSDVIYGDMWRMSPYVDGKPKEKIKHIRLCGSCKEALIEGE